MFTGLIQKVGKLKGLTRKGRGAILEVGHEPWVAPLECGESVSVQGACLTVTSAASASFKCDALAETLQRTTLSTCRQGALLNLERAMRTDDRFGGHVVSGHVDGTGVVSEIREQDGDHVLRVNCDASLLDGIVPKGSIACQGVSLTVTGLGDSWFEVSIIPYTWEHTCFHAMKRGDTVNLETDVIGKYIRKYIGASRERPARTCGPAPRWPARERGEPGPRA